MSTFITEAELASYLQLAVGAVPVDAMAVVLTNGEFTDLFGATYDPATAPTRVKSIALEVAARGWRNPQGFSSVTVGIDDYDKTVRREGGALTLPGVYLTVEERAELLGYLGITSRRVGSIRLRVPDESRATDVY